MNDKEIPEDGGAGFGTVELPESASPAQYRETLDIVSLPFKIAVLLIVAGVALMVGGFSGLVDFGIEGNGFQVAVQRASPGLVTVILGAVLAATYKPNIRVGGGGGSR